MKKSDQVQKINFFFLQTCALVLAAQFLHCVFSGISCIQHICEPAQTSLPFSGQMLLIVSGDLTVMLTGLPCEASLTVTLIRQSLRGVRTEIHRHQTQVQVLFLVIMWSRLGLLNLLNKDKQTNKNPQQENYTNHSYQMGKMRVK